MMEFKEHKVLLRFEDVFDNCSRWWLFWNFIVKRKGLKATWAFSPPDTVSEVNIDFLRVECVDN